MKQLTILFAVLLSCSSVQLLSQDKPGNEKEPVKPSLIIIDFQNEFLPMIPEQDKKIATLYINAYISLFRQNNLPIIRVYHTDPDWGPNPDSAGFQYPEEIQISPEDPMIVKNYPNSFKKTDLNNLLKEKDCNTLLLCGLSSVGCVISTYFGAKDLDYNVFMLKDAIVSHNAVYTDNIEIIFDAIGYDAANLIIQQSAK